MNNIKIKTLFLAFVVSLTSVSTPVIANSSPQFSLPGTTNDVSLEQYKGSVVYLDFWASWCSPCRKSFPWMNDMQSRYREAGLTVIAINLDESQELAESFLKNMSIDFTIAFDKSGQTAADFNILAMPSSFLIDRDGKIIHKHLGFRQKDKAAIEHSIQKALGMSA